MHWVIMPLRRYADFSGRSQRKEFWLFVLAAGFLLGVEIGIAETSRILGGILVSVTALGLFIPYLAVKVRRFHDQDKSGWMILLGVIPYVGGLITLVFMCIDGTQGPNRFGEDPKSQPRGDLQNIFA